MPESKTPIALFLFKTFNGLSLFWSGGIAAPDN
jgi:hypothetical protein